MFLSLKCQTIDLVIHEKLLLFDTVTKENMMSYLLENTAFLVHISSSLAEFLSKYFEIRIMKTKN